MPAPKYESPISEFSSCLGQGFIPIGHDRNRADSECVVSTLFATPVPSVAPRTRLTGPSRPPWRQMNVVLNQTPEPQKPPRHLWEWLVMFAALASVWFGLCVLVQLLIAG